MCLNSGRMTEGIMVTKCLILINLLYKLVNIINLKILILAFKYNNF